MAKAEKTLSLDDMVALMPKIEMPEPPETKVVRPMFGAAGNAALKADPEFEHDQDAVLADFGRAMRQLRVIREDDEADG